MRRMRGSFSVSVVLFSGLLFWPAVAGAAAEEVTASLVKLSTTVDGSRRTGTGFVVALEQDTAYIVTAAHVVAGNASAEAEFLSDPAGSHQAEVFRVDHRSDLALLRVSRAPGEVEALLISGRKVPAGAAATVVGFPRRASAPRFANVTVSNLEGSSLVLTGLVDSGSSGSPVLEGQVVIGLVTETTQFYPRAIPGATLRLVLTGWLAADLLSEPTEEASRRVPGPGEDVAGSTIFEGPVALRDSVAVFNPTQPVTIHQAGPRFFLRADLETLSLGERSTLRIASSPASALSAVACSWEIDPPDFVSVRGDVRSDCALEVAMPIAPDRRYGPLVAMRITSRITRSGEFLEEVTTKTQLKNGISLIARVSGEPLTPTGEVRVVIAEPGASTPLAKDFRCLWQQSSAMPIHFEPSAPNGCAGRIAFRPMAELSAPELATWVAIRMAGMSPTWIVKATYRDVSMPGAITQVQVDVSDPRSTVEIQAELAARSLMDFKKTKQETSRSIIDDALSRDGLPPVSSLNPSNLRMVAKIDNDSWSLSPVYLEPGSEAAPVALDGKSSVLKIETSGDGVTFQRWGYVGRSRDLQGLANLDQLWIRFSVGVGSGVQAGPFRLPVDGPALLREGLLQQWDESSPEQRQRIACDGFVVGAGYSNQSETKALLAVIESVSVRRVGGTLWRTQTYDAGFDALTERSFTRLPRPLGGSDYTVRIQFRGRPPQEVACRATSGRGGLQVGDPPDGLHHVLKRVSGEDPEAPVAIEVFVDEDWKGRWKVHYDPVFKPAFIRVSTDGKSFQTRPADSRNGNAVLIDEAAGKLLHLRFVKEDGSEVGYRGKLDFDQQRRTVLLRSLLRSLNPSCRVAGAGDSHSMDSSWNEFDALYRTVEDAEHAVRCQILTHKGWGSHGAGPIQLGKVLPVLRHIQFGCSREQMDHREDFKRFRSRQDLDRIYLSFGLAERCETVFAQLLLNDGSKSEVLVIPVVTGG